MSDCPIILEDLLRWGIKSEAIASLELTESDMEQPWDEVLSYLRAAPNITLPLTADQVTLTLKQKACVLMTWNIMSVKGFDPTANAQDAVLRMRYEDAITWFEKVAAGKIQPIPPAEVEEDPVDDGTVTGSDSGGVVTSEASRGWRDALL
ncbi:MAG: phage protein Gp36 family protein [Bryobacteraceae bacterium]